MEDKYSEIGSSSEEFSFFLSGSSLELDKSAELNGYVENEDTRSELRFDQVKESEGEIQKRREIEKALDSKDTNLKTWQDLALREHGLVGDDLRRKIWPLLLEVDPTSNEDIPSLDELSTHTEYSQVILDVNRSLSRFPPGIPYKQRLALQDQLTVLILRVIMKYPHLRYYQGYHDVAITFLLVVGEAVAFRIMQRLSTDHLRECMEPTMEKTSYTLNYIYSLLHKVDPELHKFMDSSGVGTMFALPWYLTWFGHSLHQYKDVVRLYDYFLASPRLMPLYVASSLVIERRTEVFNEGCDLASIHCLLSQIPNDLDFETILKRAANFYETYPPKKLESGVRRRVQNEKAELKRQEELRRRMLNPNASTWRRFRNSMPLWMILNIRSRYGLLFATATVLIGLYAYYLRTTNPKFTITTLWS